MSGPAIGPAPSAIPGANPAGGAGVGVGVQPAQAHGPLAGFEAVLTALSAGQAPGADGTASAPVKGGLKITPGAMTALNEEPDGKPAGDGKIADADAATAAGIAAGTAAAIIPDPTLLALMVPPPNVALQATPLAAENAENGAGQAAVATAVDKPSGQTSAASFTQLAAGQSTTAISTALNPEPDKPQAVAQAAALAASSAAIDAGANAKADAVAAPKADTAQVAPAPATPPAPPAAPSLTAPPAPVVVEPAIASLTPAPVAAAAQSTEAVTPVDAKEAGARLQAPKASTRIDATKVANAPAAAANADANVDAVTAKAGEALQTVSDGAAKPDLADEASKDPVLEAKSDATGPSQAPADPATASTTTPATLIHAAAVALRGAPQTVANLAAQIVKKLDGRSTQFDIQLDPAGLGKVDVRVAIGADGRMSAAMSFDTPQAAAELKSRAGELQRAMEQAGFDVSGGMSFDVASDRGQGGQAQNQQPDAGAAFRGRAFQAALDTTADTAPPPQLTLRRSALAGVDIRI